MVGLAFELHDTASACRNLKSASDDVPQSLALRIKYQQVDPSFVDMLMYSFCYIGLLTGTCNPVLVCLASLLCVISNLFDVIHHYLILFFKLYQCNCVITLSKMYVSVI